jgi:hypothetical protein
MKSPLNSIKSHSMYAHETTIKSPDAFFSPWKPADARIYRACRISTGLEDGQKMATIWQTENIVTWELWWSFWGHGRKNQGSEFSKFTQIINLTTSSVGNDWANKIEECRCITVYHIILSIPCS